jgi:prevent-host-death family protein
MRPLRGGGGGSPGGEVGVVTNVERMSTVEARNRFSRVINRASYGRERIMLTCRGFPMAAVVSVDDLLRLIRADERNRALAHAPPPRDPAAPPETTAETGARIAAELRRELHEMAERDRGL